jgi:hypothetical protein
MKEWPYLISELVDLQRDGADGAVGALDLGVLLALNVPPLQARRVFGQHHLGLVLHAARVQVLRVVAHPAFVRQLLVRRLQPRPRRQQLLQLPCIDTDRAISAVKYSSFIPPAATAYCSPGLSY